VFRAATRLVSGQQLSGLAVSSVDQEGPGYDAGIRAEHIRAARAAVQVGATVLVIGAAAFFPPAIFGVPLLAQMQTPRAYDVIVAVDAERIQDVSELEYSLRKAMAGETIYLTIIRNGRRMQLQLPMPGIISTSAPTLPK